MKRKAFAGVALPFTHTSYCFDNTNSFRRARSSYIFLSCSLTSSRSRLRQRLSDTLPPDAEDLMAEM